MKPVIIHCYRSKFLPITETFIESQIKNLENFIPVVLAREIDERFMGEEFLFGKNFRIFARKDNWLMKFLRKMSFSEKRFFSEIIESSGAKALHIHFASDAWYFLGLKKKTGLPLVVSFYGYDAYQLPKRFFGFGGKIILKQVFKKADMVIAPSQHMKKQLVGLGCEEGKIEVVCWGVETLQCVETRQCLVSTMGDAPIRFIHIGRMVEKKGQIYLLKAFKEILDRGVDAELAIIGDGPFRKKMLYAIDKLGIYANVKLIRSVNNEGIIQELMPRDIYLQPSVIAKNGDQEGIPTAIMEAFACGLPVIATAHSGIPEIIKNNVNGILILERDTKALADAMEKLAKNAEMRKRFGENGRKVVEERFDAKRQMRKLEELYFKLINADKKRITADHGSVISENPF